MPSSVHNSLGHQSGIAIAQGDQHPDLSSLRREYIWHIGGSQLRRRARDELVCPKTVDTWYQTPDIVSSVQSSASWWLWTVDSGQLTSERCNAGARSGYG